MKAATLVIYQYAEPHWQPILPAEVPAWIKEPTVVNDLVEGAILERDGIYYRALKGADCPLIIPDAKRIRVAH